MVCLFYYQVPVMGFGSMKNLYSLVGGVNTVSIGKYMKVPTAYEGNLKGFLFIYNLGMGYRYMHSYFMLHFKCRLRIRLL